LVALLDLTSTELDLRFSTVDDDDLRFSAVVDDDLRFSADVDDELRVSTVVDDELRFSTVIDDDLRFSTVEPLVNSVCKDSILESLRSWGTLLIDRLGLERRGFASSFSGLFRPLFDTGLDFKLETGLNFKSPK